MLKKTVFLILLPLLFAGCESYFDVSEATDHHQADVFQSFEIGVTDLATALTGEYAPKLIDVREAFELTDTGIVAGSLHLPLGGISADSLADLGFAKDEPIVTICRSGSRSAQAMRLMNALGYTNVQSLQGGVIHWEEDGAVLVPWAGASVAPVLKKVELERQDAANMPRFTLGRTEHDFGEILQFGGVVTADFQITNSGVGELELGQVTTSCSCTTAKLSSVKLAAGEIATLQVIFDPDFHEEPLDRFRRTVFIPTNDPTQPEAEINIWVDILEGQ